MMDKCDVGSKVHGPLPYPDQVSSQLKEAGFDNIQFEKLVPGFFLFKAGLRS